MKAPLTLALLLLTLLSLSCTNESKRPESRINEATYGPRVAIPATENKAVEITRMLDTIKLTLDSIRLECNTPPRPVKRRKDKAIVTGTDNRKVLAAITDTTALVYFDSAYIPQYRTFYDSRPGIVFAEGVAWKANKLDSVRQVRYDHAGEDWIETERITLKIRIADGRTIDISKPYDFILTGMLNVDTTNLRIK